MWVNLAKWFVQVLLIPLLKDGADALVKYFKRKKEIEVRAEQNLKKAEAHAQSDSVNRARDTFNKLP